MHSLTNSFLSASLNACQEVICSIVSILSPPSGGIFLCVTEFVVIPEMEFADFDDTEKNLQSLAAYPTTPVPIGEDKESFHDFNPPRVR